MCGEECWQLIYRPLSEAKPRRRGGSNPGLDAGVDTPSSLTGGVDSEPSALLIPEERLRPPQTPRPDAAVNRSLLRRSRAASILSLRPCGWASGLVNRWSRLEERRRDEGVPATLIPFPERGEAETKGRVKPWP